MMSSGFTGLGMQMKQYAKVNIEASSQGWFTFAFLKLTQ